MFHKIKYGLLFLFFCAKSLFAQVDPHFTQYYAFPAWLNPALSGVINGGDCRLVAIHRNQWNKIIKPFTTAGVSCDWLTKKTWGMGVQAIYQLASSGGYQNGTLSFSICNNNIAWGEEEKHHLSLALQLGINNRSIRPEKFQYGDQYNPVMGYDPSINSRADDWINRNSILQPDAGAGLFYYFSKSDVKITPFAGFSVYHINRPKDNFSDRESIIPIRYVANIGASIITETPFSWSPTLFYMQQGKSTEVIAGCQGEYQLSYMMGISAGCNYRIGDAVNVLTSLYLNRTRFGFSYDVNTSSLRSYGRPANSMEFSITRTIMRRDPFQDMIERCPKIKL